MRSLICRGVLTLAAVTLAAPGVAAQSPSGRDRWADSARVLIDAGTQRSDAKMLAEAGVLLDRALEAFPSDALLLHYRGYGLYREGMLMRAERKENRVAEATFTAALEALEKSAAKLQMPESIELQAAVMGQLIGTSDDPAAASARLGPLSGIASRRAFALAPENPRLYLIRGIGSFNTPAAYGGGVEKAMQDLTRAVELFQTDRPPPPLPAWGRGEAYIWLGQGYLRTDKKDSARAMFEKAIEVEPNNAWARDLLARVTRQR